MSARENYNVVNKIQAMLAECGDGLEIWNKVFHFILQNKRYLRDLWDIKNIIGALARKLLSSGCEDSEIVSRIFCMYRRWIEEGYEICDATVNFILKPLDHVSYRLNDFDDADDCFLTAVDRGDLDIVKLCIKYGNTDEGSFASHNDYFLAEFKFIIKQRMFHQHVYHYEIQWAEDFIEALYYKRGEIGNNPRGIRRIYTLLDVLSKLHHKIKDNDKTYTDIHIQCLRIYFNVVNEPFVAQHEMKDFLKVIFAGEENCEEVVEEVISIYRGMFPPDTTLVYEPRSLKHQARCAFRKYLSYQTENITLPKLISQQNVPPIVKELLLGAPEFKS